MSRGRGRGMSQSTIRVTPLHVAGEAVAGGETIDVHSPFDDSLVGTVPVVGADSARVAVDAAAEAMAAGLPSHERAAILDRAAAIMRDRRQEEARTLAGRGVVVDAHPAGWAGAAGRSASRSAWWARSRRSTSRSIWPPTRL